MEPEKLIGRKVKGFKFESNENVSYIDSMDEYIEKIGIIKKYYPANKTFEVYFEDDFWHYPADQIEAHLVEDEIPTLSDGVMMLVSDDFLKWEEKEVLFKINNMYVTREFVPYIHCKPLEPTKEEQLKAILGSSDKVSEIMELFKN